MIYWQLRQFNTNSTMNNIEKTINECINYLRRLYYKKCTISRYEKYLGAFQIWTKNKELSDISQSVVDLYFLENDITDLSCKNNRSKRNLRRVIEILLFFKCHGFIYKKRAGKEKFLTKRYRGILENYMKYCENELFLSPRSFRQIRSSVYRFFNFCTEKEVYNISGITPLIIKKFFECYICARASTTALMATNLRRLFKYLSLRHDIPSELGKCVPKIKIIRHRNLPDSLSEDVIEKLISAIDKSSPLGKRDYPMILLAARLGMRIGDIKSLKFDNFNWEDSSIKYTISKTKASITLPMSNEIGNAIIEYIKYGRPKVESRYIFLRHIPPYAEFNESQNLYTIIEKYLNKAKVKLPRAFKCGFHSLRHSIATKLYEKGVSLENIQALLGHCSTESTRNYTRINIEQLRAISLELDGGRHE